jgi:hypothetical protein
MKLEDVVERAREIARPFFADKARLLSEHLEAEGAPGRPVPEAIVMVQAYRLRYCTSGMFAAMSKRMSARILLSIWR